MPPAMRSLGRAKTDVDRIVAIVVPTETSMKLFQGQMQGVRRVLLRLMKSKSATYTASGVSIIFSTGVMTMTTTEMSPIALAVKTFSLNAETTFRVIKA